MEAVANEYFSNCSKNKSVFTAGEIEKHKFSSFKASLANKASVALCTVTFNDTEYKIVRVTWGKPHYFICSETDCQWVQGDTDLEFSDMYTYVVSLKEYLSNLQAVAAKGVLPKWAELDKYVKASDNYYMNLLKM